MIPKPGTVLIKIAPSSAVYVLEANNVLRWIPNEELAAMLYGPDWTQYVIDIPPTLWGQFTIGADISVANSTLVRHALLRTRSSLNGE